MNLADNNFVYDEAIRQIQQNNEFYINNNNNKKRINFLKKYY
jgi:hypothetical protein